MEQVTRNYFLYILKCFYRGAECEAPGSEIDYSYLYNLAKIHDVQGIVFTKLKDMDSFKNSEYYDKLQGEFFAFLRHSIYTETNLKTLTDILNENNIPHILFKGAVIKNCYPSKELRTMSDIDILVDSKYTDKANGLLLDSGFVPNGDHTHSNVKGYLYNNTAFEMHQCIASRNCYIHSAPFVDFFSDARDHRVLIDNNTYTLEPTYHLVFLLYHILKHFERGGCGIRMFLDFPFFVDYYRESLDYQLLGVYLNKLKLTDFASSVFQLCNRIFDYPMPEIFNKTLDDETMDKFVHRILCAGTFGAQETQEHKVFIKQLRMNQGMGRISSVFRLIFPTREEMHYYNIWDINKPLITLPVGYIKRFYRHIFKSKSYGKVAKVVFKKDVDKDEVEFINKLGINK